jgi:hypothetical protein
MHTERKKGGVSRVCTGTVVCYTDDEINSDSSDINSEAYQ